jgi:hypothetical protein
VLRAQKRVSFLATFFEVITTLPASKVPSLRSVPEDAAGTAKPNKSGFVKSKVTSPAFAILKAATTVNNESNNFLIIIMFLKITLQSYVIF